MAISDADWSQQLETIQCKAATRVHDCFINCSTSSSVLYSIYVITFPLQFDNKLLFLTHHSACTTGFKYTLRSAPRWCSTTVQHLKGVQLRATHPRLWYTSRVTRAWTLVFTISSTCVLQRRASLHSPGQGVLQLNVARGRENGIGPNHAQNILFRYLRVLSQLSLCLEPGEYRVANK